ncbi:MAG TPA: sigma 54-interacting transcriptional regulator [Polyangiaceae bacterium]
MRSESSLTTSPADQTGNRAADAGSEALRWVFPESMLGPTLPLSPELQGGLGKPGEKRPVRLLLGRGEDCAFRLVGSDTSRRHAVIERVGPVFVVRDMNSRNGVFVDGRRVDAAPLSVGSVLRLGECVAVVVKARADEASCAFDELAEGLFGGPILRASTEIARRSAGSALPILLEGETGTGKELFARAIHAWSGRKGPFRAVNCAALPEGLAEAELFGYRKGAFTGADRASLGHFRAADGGTLLLDEIIDMPRALQAKVLRVLEQREVVPLGETRSLAIDVRVIAAAQSSLAQAAVERRFRSDLLARLDGVRLRLPPLRERKQEIAWVFQRLLARHAGGRPPQVEARLIERLCLYDWPGNVRELDLVTRRMLTLHGHETLLRHAHLPAQLSTVAESRLVSQSRIDSADEPARGAPALARSAGTGTEHEARETPDLEALTAALSRVGGNVAQAAAALGISRQRAYRLLGESAEAQLSSLRAETSGGEGARPVHRTSTTRHGR